MSESNCVREESSKISDKVLTGKSSCDCYYRVLNFKKPKLDVALRIKHSLLEERFKKTMKLLNDTPSTCANSDRLDIARKIVSSAKLILMDHYKEFKYRLDGSFESEHIHSCHDAGLVCEFITLAKTKPSLAATSRSGESFTKVMNAPSVYTADEQTDEKNTSREEAQRGEAVQYELSNPVTVPADQSMNIGEGEENRDTRLITSNLVERSVSLNEDCSHQDTRLTANNLKSMSQQTRVEKVIEDVLCETLVSSRNKHHDTSAHRGGSVSTINNLSDQEQGPASGRSKDCVEFLSHESATGSRVIDLSHYPIEDDEFNDTDSEDDNNNTTEQGQKQLPNNGRNPSSIPSLLTSAVDEGVENDVENTVSYNEIHSSIQGSGCIPSSDGRDPSDKGTKCDNETRDGRSSQETDDSEISIVEVHVIEKRTNEIGLLSNRSVKSEKRSGEGGKGSSKQLKDRKLRKTKCKKVNKDVTAAVAAAHTSLNSKAQFLNPSMFKKQQSTIAGQVNDNISKIADVNIETTTSARTNDAHPASTNNSILVDCNVQVKTEDGSRRIHYIIKHQHLNKDDVVFEIQWYGHLHTSLEGPFVIATRYRWHLNNYLRDLRAESNRKYLYLVKKCAKLGIDIAL